MPSLITETICLRISLVPAIDLNKRITTECELQSAAGYRLAASFALSTELVLIFQKAPV
jgi:hypothetical protein